MVHALKTTPPWYDDVASSLKPFEIRKDDRGYSVDDDLLLCEYIPEQDKFTGRATKARVSYLFRDDTGIPGLEPGYVIMGLSLNRVGFIPKLQGVAGKDQDSLMACTAGW